MTAVEITEGARFAGRYLVLRRIQAGGMGAVYEVLDEKTERRRALKVMLPNILEDAEQRTRFAREATVAKDVDSEHIVETFDAGIDETTGTPFLVMELLKGCDLGQVLKERGRLSPIEVVALLQQLALALSKTHAQGIVHRDLKPENLFLTLRDDGSWRIKVLDFGIAKVVAAHADRAGSTRSLGTPLYMPPEQLDGDARIDGRADLYAAAQIAYALLTGNPYWSDERERSEAIYPFLMKICEGAKEPATLRAARRGVTLPDDFDAWFARATAVKAALRFGTALELVAELAKVLGENATTAAVVGPLPAKGATVVEPTRAGEDLAGLATEVAPPPVDAGRSKSADTRARSGPAASQPNVEPGNLASRRSRKLLVAAAGVILFGAAAAAIARVGPFTVREQPSVIEPSVPPSPLADADSVLGCPILKAEGVTEPSGWIGAAAASLACKRASILFGVRDERTRVPAELLELPRAHTDEMPSDPYVAPDARERSLAAARSSTQAYLDGHLTQVDGTFDVTLELRAADERELGSATARRPTLHEAVYEAVEELGRSGVIPARSEPDARTLPWLRFPSLETERLADDVAGALMTRSSVDQWCAEARKRRAELGAQFVALNQLCSMVTFGWSRDDSPVALDRSSPAALALTAAPYIMRTPQGDAAALTAELRKLREAETSPRGRAWLAIAEARILFERGDVEAARPLAISATTLLPRDAEARSTAGRIALGTKALASASVAATIWSPEDPDTWRFLADQSGVRGAALARRSYELAPHLPLYGTTLATHLFFEGKLEQARAIGALFASGDPYEQVAGAYVLGTVELLERRPLRAFERFDATFQQLPDFGRLADGDISALLVFLEAATLLGRQREASGRVVERFVLAEPHRLSTYEGHYEQPMILACMLAPTEVGKRGLERLAEIRKQGAASGGQLAGADAAWLGAAAYVRGDVRGAVKAWRPVVATGDFFGFLLPTDAFDAAGDAEAASRLDTMRIAYSTPGSPRMAHVREARRALGRGDTKRARELAGAFVAVWSGADAEVPAVAEMKRLLATSK